jgi:hypothetical protein
LCPQAGVAHAICHRPETIPSYGRNNKSSDCAVVEQSGWDRGEWPVGASVSKEFVSRIALPPDAYLGENAGRRKHAPNGWDTAGAGAVRTVKHGTSRDGHQFRNAMFFYGPERGGRFENSVKPGTQVELFPDKTATDGKTGEEMVYGRVYKNGYTHTGWWLKKDFEDGKETGAPQAPAKDTPRQPASRASGDEGETAGAEPPENQRAGTVQGDQPADSIPDAQTAGDRAAVRRVHFGNTSQAMPGTPKEEQRPAAIIREVDENGKPTGGDQMKVLGRPGIYKTEGNQPIPAARGEYKPDDPNIPGTTVKLSKDGDGVFQVKDPGGNTLLIEGKPGKSYRITGLDGGAAVTSVTGAPAAQFTARDNGNFEARWAALDQLPPGHPGRAGMWSKYDPRTRTRYDFLAGEAAGEDHYGYLWGSGDVIKTKGKVSIRATDTRLPGDGGTGQVRYLEIPDSGAMEFRPDPDPTLAGVGLEWRGAEKNWWNSENLKFRSYWWNGVYDAG